MDRHWSDGYYGELYRTSVAGLLGPALSDLEGRAVARLLALGPADRVLDLGCGEGRHAPTIAPRVGLLVGLERDPGSIVAARASGLVPVQGDLRAPPFRPGSFDAVYSWYASLFMYDDPENERVLALAVSLLRPGGRILVHHANPARLARDPEARASRDLEPGVAKRPGDDLGAAVVAVEAGLGDEDAEGALVVLGHAGLLPMAIRSGASSSRRSAGRSACQVLVMRRSRRPDRPASACHSRGL